MKRRFSGYRNRKNIGVLGTVLFLSLFNLPPANSATAIETEPIRIQAERIQPKVNESTSNPAISREEIMDREMNCISVNQAKGDLNWDDVCSIRSASDQAVSDSMSAGEESGSSAPIQLASNDTVWPFAKSKWADDPIFNDRYLKKELFGERKTHSFDLGEETYYNHYDEHDARVELTGIMVGYFGNYTFRPQDDSILNNAVLNTYSLEGRWAKGDLDYEGSGTINNKANTSYESRALLGKDYLLTDESLLNFYFGFGYRNLIDRGNGRLSTTNNYAYDRHSNYYYVPVGFKAILPPKFLNSEVNVEYDCFVGGVQVSDLSNGRQFTGFNNPDIRNHQEKGYGVRASLKIAYRTKFVDIFGEPFIRYWDIEDSKVSSASVDGTDGGFIEPHNRTVEVGSKFGLQF